jgi:hypothetical protein
MIETLQKINKIVPNLTVSQLIELVNIINGFKRYTTFITINTSDNKTTSTENPFSVSSYL